jgi:hypothetical protein
VDQAARKDLDGKKAKVRVVYQELLAPVKGKSKSQYNNLI